MNIPFAALIEYTSWQRARWRSKLDAAALATSLGSHGDGRFSTIGDVVRHIFSAEIRYCGRLTGETPQNTSGVATDNVEALFAFGERSRARLEELIGTLPGAVWDTPREFTMMNFRVVATPRKIVTHVLLHEIRHWAQIATVLRVAGISVEFHDFLVSPVLGGEFTVQ